MPTWGHSHKKTAHDLPSDSQLISDDYSRGRSPPPLDPEKRVTAFSTTRNLPRPSDALDRETSDPTTLTDGWEHHHSDAAFAGESV